MIRAIRDAESRTRFLGYRVESYKLWVFVFSAVIAGVAGALYVPQVGIINPSEFAPINSIEVVIWVAVGGRGTLYGAAARRGAGQLRQDLSSPARCPRSGCTRSARCSCWSRCSCRAGIIGLLAGRGEGDDEAAHGAPDASQTPATRQARWQETRVRRHRARAPSSNCVGKILYLENLTVSFDGFKALNDLTLYVDPGELRCIIGPNGAGKTTMMDVITGKTRPDQGSAWFGRNVDLLTLTEPEIAQAGIGRKFQKPTVFEQLTVFENLELALAGDKSFWKMLLARLTAAAARAHRRGARDDRPDRRSAGRWPARCRTARSSGSRSACC